MTCAPRGIDMHVVDEQRAQHQEGVAVGGLDHAALGQADHRVVGDGSAVGVELAARRQDHRVVPALGVGELDAVPDDEGTGPCAGAVSALTFGHSRSACHSGLAARRALAMSVSRPRLGACPSKVRWSDRGRRCRPSRAADFKQCPLLYRFRAIDRLPEPPSTAQLRGSVVHSALEQLYGMPAADRVPQTALSLVDPAWERVLAAHPDLVDGLRR